MSQHAVELAQGARQLGVALSEQQQEKLLGYMALLNKWNKAYNLTAVRDPNRSPPQLQQSLRCAVLKSDCGAFAACSSVLHR